MKNTKKHTPRQNPEKISLEQKIALLKAGCVILTATITCALLYIFFR